MFKKSISVLCTVIAGLCSTFEQGISKEIVFKWGEGNSSSAPIELKEHVIFSLLQENIRHKVEETLLELGIPYTMQLDKNTLPTQFSLVFNDDESETVESLNIFSEKNHTYFLEEFDQIKETWIGWIQKQRTRYVDSAHTEFLDDLENILWEVSPEDLIERFQLGLQYENKELEIFLALPLIQEYKEMIRLFITDFANKNAALLIADRKGMEKRKEELAVIHPLKHIAFVWTDPELSQSMGIIKKTRFKWTRYLKGMARALKRHKLAGTLNEYVPGFADFLEADRSIIQKHLDRDNYRELFEYLFQLETYKKNVS